MAAPRSSKVKTTLAIRDKKHLAKLGNAWQVDDKQKKLVGTFTFKSYIEAFMFVTRISVHAEVRHKYPELLLSHDKVKITLTHPSTHVVTSAEIEFAYIVDQLYLSTPLKPKQA